MFYVDVLRFTVMYPGHHELLLKIIKEREAFLE